MTSPRTMKVNRFAGTGGDEYVLRHPWPEDCFVQGGHNGVVLGPKGYTTAYFEAFPSTFIRGEGEDLGEAEDAAWRQYERHLACPVHDFKPHRPGQPGHLYSNGGAFCQLCGLFDGNHFSGEDLGQFCSVCGVGTTWAHYGPQVRFDPDSIFEIRDDSPEEDKVWFCESHSPYRQLVLENRARKRRKFEEWLDEKSS